MDSKRFLMTVSDNMEKALEEERKIRRLNSLQETVRQIISDYLSNKTR